ncbi:MraY family glycosyltransferase [Zhihengliuella flava]|uniref:UDP-GlcNAc:undecaprenyl-phosphate GlcNAc-1-phosphate transferase n=1 Tax=Zhihengliuella flava TaxID=1285193 RepID=A0A931DBF0_9MICC|nr:MraY family glycosyltransferase [Zhihengliuella flava]MBG6083640.1 UDP-GlcNAc:undecaprenyl-phosphate GlcNAc-1-phosphate transferase [Zhihengliuella flava]
MRLYLLLIGLTFAISFLLTPLVRRIGARVGPSEVRERDVHKSPIPKLGGVAMIVAILLGLAVASRMDFLQGSFRDPGPVLGVLAAAILALVIGVIDDLRDLSWYYKLGGQILIGAVAVSGGIRLEAMPVGWIGIPSGPAQWLLTVFLIVLTMNAINFVDGLDGLAAGVGAIGATAFFVYCYWLARTINQYDNSNFAALLMALLLGACLGFLPHNFNPAKIFMGESGVMVIGLLMAVAAIMVTGDVGAQEGYRFRNIPAYMPILLPVAVILLPLLDLALAVIRRTANGRSPFSADRGHLHHKLVDGGYTQRQAVLVLYLWSAIVAFGSVAFIFKEFDWHIIVGVNALLTVGAAILTMWPWLRRSVSARRQRRGM